MIAIINQNWLLYNNSISDIERTIEKLGGLSEKQKGELKSALQRERTLQILACGMWGTGKSTLLNGICGREKFQVGALGDQEVKTITKHTIEEGSCKLILTEVSGFDGGPGDDEHLDNIKNECADADVLFYCVSVSALQFS